MPLAARISDDHHCPKFTHKGGPIALGCPTVLIGGLHAAREGDQVACSGSMDTIAQGSKSVFIGGKAAARTGDQTAHGGKIIGGCPTVIIGDSGGASIVALIAQVQETETDQRPDDPKSSDGPVPAGADQGPDDPKTEDGPVPQWDTLKSDVPKSDPRQAHNILKGNATKYVVHPNPHPPRNTAHVHTPPVKGHIKLQAEIPKMGEQPKPLKGEVKQVEQKTPANLPDYGKPLPVMQGDFPFNGTTIHVSLRSGHFVKQGVSGPVTTKSGDPLYSYVEGYITSPNTLEVTKLYNLRGESVLQPGQTIEVQLRPVR